MSCPINSLAFVANKMGRRQGGPSRTGGGGQGSSDLNNVIAGDGFCGPQGGSPALGQASFNSGLTTAKLDLDGNPLGQGQDPDWNPETSGQVNGQAVNSAKYAYVVMSIQQMNASGVSLGDWASVKTLQQARAFTLVWKTKALLAALGRYPRRRLVL